MIKKQRNKRNRSLKRMGRKRRRLAAPKRKERRTTTMNQSGVCYIKKAGKISKKPT